MQSVAICGEELSEVACPRQESVTIAGREIKVGLVRTHDTKFDPSEAKFKNCALVEVKSFSCNYRDKALLLRFHELCRKGGLSYFGSEFSGEVLEVGVDVTDFKAGDRVMGNGSYPDSGEPGVRGGLPTNCGSKRMLIVPAARLMKLPPEMSFEIGAAFQIGAQTTYSMVRRLGLQAGETVLVTAARSNTSLAAFNALKALPVDVYGLSSADEEYPWPDMEELVKVERGQKFSECEQLVALAKKIGGFDAVIDPFMDLHLWQSLPFMKKGGRYVTCGCYRQADEFDAQQSEAGGSLFQVGSLAMMNNLSIIGNCLGTTSDLERAVRDYAAGRLEVVVDSVFSGLEVRPFVERTYNEPGRFGKVVYNYRS